MADFMIRETWKAYDISKVHREDYRFEHNLSIYGSEFEVLKRYFFYFSR